MKINAPVVTPLGTVKPTYCVPQNRDKFARAIQPHIKDALALGLPAILGIYRTAEVVFDLEKKLGVPIFEIPTMLISVPGMRLKEAFHQRLPGKGVQIFFQKRVLVVRPQTDGCFVLYIGNQTTEHTIRSSEMVLASGRFLGGGLHADRKGVRETILNHYGRFNGNKVKHRLIS